MTHAPTMIAAALSAGIAIALTAAGGPRVEAQRQDAVQVEHRHVAPGDVLNAADVRIIERPGNYGLGSQLPGSRYAVTAGQLVRIDAHSLRVQSVLRPDAEAAD